MKVEVEVSDLVERKADAKGRVAIGPDKAGKQVTLAVIEVEDEDDDGDE
ncbi:hypothetical protein [Halorubrum coriense]|nr:hypothetical protein [Halorubrum coriense]